jgi:hypothetical protein
MSLSIQATGNWLKNNTLEQFKFIFATLMPLHVVSALDSENESNFESTGVINSLMHGARGGLLSRIINWFQSWYSYPTTTFTVFTMRSGRGTNDYRTYTVEVDYLSGNVVNIKNEHYTNTSGFPKEGEPNYNQMLTAANEHVHLNPDFVFVWGSAYYLANDSKFSDGGEFQTSSLENLPTANSFTQELPFLSGFSHTPTMVLRNLKLSSGNFKPGWGTGLVFPENVRKNVYGDLGSAEFKLIKTSTGEKLTCCDVDVNKMEESAISIQSILEHWVMSSPPETSTVERDANLVYSS